MTAKSSPKISVVGLGKLGSPLSAVMAKAGFDVIGIDFNKDIVASINAGRAPIEEPQLQIFLEQSEGRLRATTEYAQAIINTDVTMVIVPTPIQEDGYFTNEYLIASLREIGAAIKLKESYHLVVITSTVMPGSTGGILRQTLEEASGRKLGETLGLAYNPEFIALGSVINDMLYPDFILIGESDDKAGELLSSIYNKSCEKAPEFRRMNFVNAELCKIAVNTYVTTKISYANMLSEICDNLPGADVDIVTNAVGSDSRIGTKYFKGGLGYGGPCFPRDNLAFTAMGANLGVKCDLARATDLINNHQVSRLCGAVEVAIKDNGSVAILGLSYKPGTPVIEESQGIALAVDLVSRGIKVTVHDPLALKNAEAKLGTAVSYCQSIDDAIHRANVIIIMTTEEIYKLIDLKTLDGGTTIIDPWRLYNQDSILDAQHVNLIQLGKS